MRHSVSFLLASLFISTCAFAQDPSATAEGSSSGSASSAAAGAGVLQASNVLNPNISAIGWFQAEAGHRNYGPGDLGTPGDSIQMKEVEIGLQAIVDPWSRADFFVSVGPDSVELEEGYLTWYRLPYDLAVKVGKFKTNFGRFNRIHTPETPFADRPLAQQNFLGEEGLRGPGVSLSWQVPNPWLFVDLSGEAITAPDTAVNPSFAKANQKDHVYVGRASAYTDITESINATVGASMAAGPNGESFDAINNSSSTLTGRLYAADVTFRWKNPRRAIYRSLLWSTEALWSHHDMGAGSTVNSHGLFSYVDFQFAQRWHTGIRYDYSQFPSDGVHHEQGQLAFLTYWPSEFNQISLQGRQVQRSDGSLEDLAFLKTTFNIGPHGAHPF